MSLVEMLHSFMYRGVPVLEILGLSLLLGPGLVSDLFLFLLCPSWTLTTEADGVVSELRSKLISLRLLRLELLCFGASISPHSLEITRQ